MKKNQLGGFYGLDVYSLFESLEEIKKHLEHLSPNIAEKILESYKCFESYKCDEIAYAKSLLKMPKGCQEEVVSNLRALLRLRLQETDLSKEALFDAKQNAKVISNAEKYYRAMTTGGAESWNVRDTHMMDTLEDLLKLHGPDSKAIVWAHNTHIGDYHATDMLDNGYINLGGLARERYGIENVYLLGFSSYQGEVTAGSAWGAAEEKMNLPKAKAGTYEDYFHQASINMKAAKFLTTFDRLDRHSSLYRKLGHRAVGVVYDPSHEGHGNYVPTQMAKRYDGLIFVDRTMALQPIQTTFAVEEFPETWPQGQ
jgi:erythromycin esterase-like protein